MLSLLAAFFFIASNATAQVKVLNNNLGVGINSPTYKLHVNGTAKFERGYTDLIVDNRGQGGGGGEPTIRPTRADYGFLGTSDKYFFRTYTRSIYRTNEYSLSDKRVKKNIEQLNNPLKKLSLLKGYTYELDAKKHPFISEKETKNNRQIGFVAQELKEVFPEMVELDEELGYYVIKNYEQMFPVLVEAIKAQQEQIEALQTQVKALTGTRK